MSLIVSTNIPIAVGTSLLTCEGQGEMFVGAAPSIPFPLGACGPVV